MLLVAGCALLACGSGSGFRNPFPGTCLAPLFDCWAPTGELRCTYTKSTRILEVSYDSGARQRAPNQGAQDVSAIGAGGQTCFAVTRVNDATTSYNAQGRNFSVTAVDAATVSIRCADDTTAQAPRPASNLAEIDLNFNDANGNSQGVVCRGLSCKSDADCTDGDQCNRRASEAVGRCAPP